MYKPIFHKVFALLLKCIAAQCLFLSVNPLRGARVVVINHAGTSRLEETDAARITRITSWMRSVI